MVELGECKVISVYGGKVLSVYGGTKMLMSIVCWTSQNVKLCRYMEVMLELGECKVMSVYECKVVSVY